MANLTYSIPVGESISTAWHKIKGTKATIWAALILLILIAIGLALVAALVKAVIPFLSPLVNTIVNIIDFLLEMGLLYIGIQRAADMPITYTMMFHNFKYPLWLKIIGLYILQIVIFIPCVIVFMVPIIVQASGAENFPVALRILFFIVGAVALIYLAIRMFVAMAFVLDREVLPWKAIKLSFQATRSNFWRLIAIIILQLLIILVSIIPLGIGLIWTLPFTYILYGVVYKKLLLNLPS